PNFPPASIPPFPHPTHGERTDMLDLRTGTTSDCSAPSRRTFLSVGGLSAFGLTLPAYLKARAEQPAATARAKKCILLWMQGGPSHHDSFDPKPDAPAEVRGEFGTVPTTLPGVRFADPLPMLAKQTDKLAVIRGHDPKNGSHGVADHLMMSGHKFNPSLPFPCYGSVVAKERGYVNGLLPFVQLGKAIDRRFNGGGGGVLRGPEHPLLGSQDPPPAELPGARPATPPSTRQRPPPSRRPVARAA